MNSINRYQLSTEAEYDIDDLFEYGETQFGFDAAIEYLSSVDQLFERLVENPEQGRVRPELIANLRSIRHEPYTVFYQIQDDCIWIARILRSSRDLPTLFGEE